jgi:murein DD-endopeptidase MepM/ murein hydrolase activator NlpD
MKKWLGSLPWTQWKEGLTKFWNRSGFAVVLLACAGVIGGSMLYDGWAGQAASPEASPTMMPTLRPIPTVAPPAAYEPAVATTPEPAPLMMPLLGGEGMGYAPGSLIWAQTMGEWTTHAALDLIAPEGTAVGAAADGVVSAVYEDDAWGFVVEIEHANGLVTGYASLGVAEVAQGDAVEAGDRIGTAGISAAVECEEGAHIHFYVLKDNENVNPRDYLR